MGRLLWCGLGVAALAWLPALSGQAPAAAPAATVRPGFIQVVSEPGISVLLNGKLAGVTTEDLGGLVIQNVPPGSHVILAAKEGFRAQEGRIDLPPGAIRLFHVAPFTETATGGGQPGGDTPAGQHFGTLVVRTVPVGARLRLPALGVDAVKTDTEWRHETVPAGTYEIEATALGRTLKLTATVTADARADVLFNFLRGNVETLTEEGDFAPLPGVPAGRPLAERIAALEQLVAALDNELKTVRLALRSAGEATGMGEVQRLLDRRDALERAHREKDLELRVLRQRLAAEQEQAQQAAAQERRRRFEEEYAHFRHLEQDPDLSSALLLGTWKQLCSAWSVDPGKSVGRLLWDQHAGRPYRIESRTVTLQPGVELVLVRLNPGVFRMGADDGDDDEKPVREVSITEVFWMGKHEVTQAQYQALMGRNPSQFQGADRPVESVTWQDADAFCKALTEAERRAGRLPAGHEYRLPTEAEWEYACRAGSTTAFAYGDTLEPGAANVAFPIGVGREVSAMRARQTLPVGSFKANNWDLCDVHGNVWEWCLDWYDREYYAKGQTVNPVNRIPSSSRVFRGGSWSHPPALARSANRNQSESRANHMTGFRVVLAPTSVLLPR